MKKALVLSATALLIVTTPAFAANGKSDKSHQPKEKKEQQGNEEKTEEKQKNEKIKEAVLSGQITISPTEAIAGTPTVTPLGIQSSVQSIADEECDPNADWKNHGNYVSCVAKLHLGSHVTSQAARSDVGKKHVTPSPAVSPSSTPSATPTPSVPPVTSAEDEMVVDPVANIFEFIKKVSDILSQLKLLQ